jgi:hypothetical protein
MGVQALMIEPGELEEPKRIPLWKLDEMTGNPVAPESWSNPPPPPGWDTRQVHPFYQGPRAFPQRPIRPFRGGLKITAAVTAGALLFAFSLYLQGYLMPSSLLGGPAQAPAISEPGIREPGSLIYQTGQDPAPADADGSEPFSDYPTPGREESAAPLGQPARVWVTSAAYAFSDTNKDGKPVGYDPCRPIHYVTRAANSPAAGSELIQEAIAEVSRATGLVFIDDGATTEDPSAQRESYQPGRYGDRWAPVLIAWETTAEEPIFTELKGEGTVLGRAGSESVSVGGSDYTYVSGQLELNAPALKSLIKQESLAQARGTIEHELGHIVGLDHIEDSTQLMNPTDSAGLNSYQIGDLNGLALLGQGACQPRL